MLDRARREGLVENRRVPRSPQLWRVAGAEPRESVGDMPLLRVRVVQALRRERPPMTVGELATAAGGLASHTRRRRQCGETWPMGFHSEKSPPRGGDQGG